MNRQQVKKELKAMYDTEAKILNALLVGDGTQKELDFICSKLFEIAEYIIALENYLEATKGKEE